MSDSDEHKPDEEGEADLRTTDLDESDLDGLDDEEAGDAEEDGLNLDDLDRGGVDGVVADLRNDPDEGEELVVAGRRKSRPPIISIAVIGFATYLMISMFADFKYWIGSGDPVDLGHASDFVRDGRVPDGYHDQYVVLEGTPDVQYAARLTTKENFVGYLRITEGGGALFAAIPRGKDKAVTTNFAGRYTGRMVRLGTDPAFPWLEQFFEHEKVTKTYDATADALREALTARGGDAPLDVESEKGRVTLAPSERVRVVVRQPDARVQMGMTSFRKAGEAEEAVASLGYPYLKLPAAKGTFHSFIVRIPEAQREAAQVKLLSGLDDEPDPADPKEGAVVLPMTATYSAPASVFSRSEGAVVFPYGDNTTSPGYEVDGETLVEKQLDDGKLSVPWASISAVRLEKPIVLDPNGYIIRVGADRGTERLAGIGWLVALGVALANIFALYVGWRRRAALAVQHR